MDLYEILGLRRGATVVDVRRAFQKRARQLHPAINPGDPVAAGRFEAVSLAFEVLSDPRRRAEYDHTGHLPTRPPSVPDVGFEGFDFSAEVSVGTVGFRELFEASFAASQGGSPRPGEDLEQGTRISFEEALRGTSRRLHVMRQDSCAACQGAGEVSLSPVTCPTCNGSGRVRASRGHMIFTRRCPGCGARGVLGRKPCPRCGGEGRMMQSEWLDVEIPAGVADGSLLRIARLGNAGRQGAPSGDLVLTVEVEPDPFYRREGDDLHCTVPVSLTEAALGVHVDVPTPDGPVTIEIPAGTQTGQRFRLRKRGVPRMGGKGRGDLFVEVLVRVPRVKDERSRELLRELARLHPEDPRKDLPLPPRRS
ncbi:MAG TPA: J domain-containing protein [Vicinamibacteria bacterium]|nr:J domain-containing protein [Vicinamibacteria bacterium]